MRGNREEKQALDRQTAYLTFLPPMDEGFHTGYHTAPGIVSDHNRRPREWLESLARYLQTPGIDVSYSIPDVLSAEQQLRRLSRLTPERALAHPSMAAWRAVLALLLLLILWHGVRMHWFSLPGLPRLDPEEWTRLGALDVFRVRVFGEWYRCVTALTLHADSRHLFGNVLFGAPFLILLCRRVGLGLGVFLVLLAGTFGNVLNTLYRQSAHVSLGFSTALFGTVGALSGFMALQGWDKRDGAGKLSWRRGVLLLAAGTGILAMLGTEGENTDYAAHLFGLLSGFIVGGARKLP